MPCKRWTQPPQSYTEVLKLSTLFDKDDIIIITHGQGPKCVLSLLGRS